LRDEIFLQPNISFYAVEILSQVGAMYILAGNNFFGGGSLFSYNLWA
jgi:hypothetical protein